MRGLCFVIAVHWVSCQVVLQGQTEQYNIDAAGIPSREEQTVETDAFGRRGAPQGDCSDPSLSNDQMMKCIEEQMKEAGMDPSLTERPCDIGEACQDMASKKPRRDTSRYYDRDGNDLLKASTSSAAAGSLSCTADNDCACDDGCTSGQCTGSCDHALTPGEIRIDGGGDCDKSSCYLLKGEGYTDFDSDTRSEHSKSNDKNDLNSGGCIFHNICGVPDVSAVSENGDTTVLNLVAAPKLKEAKLNRKGSRLHPRYEVTGNCVDRLGDPLVSGCYFDTSNAMCPHGYTKTTAAEEDYTFCRGDFTCVRQFDAFFLNGDYKSGQRHDPAELTTCKTSADCCGSWARWRLVYGNDEGFRGSTNNPWRSNVPVTCIPYSQISAKNFLTVVLTKTNGRDAGDKVCWLFGGATQIYKVNSIRQIPPAVHELEKALTNGNPWPSTSFLREEICTASTGDTCEDPCTGMFNTSFEVATCMCYDGITDDRPDGSTVNANGDTLEECLKLCWQTSINNSFTVESTCKGVDCDICPPTQDHQDSST